MHDSAGTAHSLTLGLPIVNIRDEVIRLSQSLDITTNYHNAFCTGIASCLAGKVRRSVISFLC
jgi:hypothetical protein